MKTFLVVILFCGLILGYLVLNKNKTGNDVITESDLKKIEEQKASEPTVEESLEAQFGISEEDAEARYASEMPQN